MCVFLIAFSLFQAFMKADKVNQERETYNPYPDPRVEPEVIFFFKSALLLHFLILLVTHSSFDTSFQTNFHLFEHVYAF